MTTKRGQHSKSRVNLKPFRKGVSSNPSGRLKGFAARIKERSGEDYEHLVEGLAPIGFGTAGPSDVHFR